MARKTFDYIIDEATEEECKTIRDRSLFHLYNPKGSVSQFRKASNLYSKIRRSHNNYQIQIGAQYFAIDYEIERLNDYEKLNSHQVNHHIRRLKEYITKVEEWMNEYLDSLID